MTQTPRSRAAVVAAVAALTWQVISHRAVWKGYFRLNHSIFFTLYITFIQKKTASHEKSHAPSQRIQTVPQFSITMRAFISLFSGSGWPPKRHRHPTIPRCRGGVQRNGAEQEASRGAGLPTGAAGGREEGRDPYGHQVGGSRGGDPMGADPQARAHHDRGHP